MRTVCLRRIAPSTPVCAVDTLMHALRCIDMWQMWLTLATGCHAGFLYITYSGENTFGADL